VDDRCKQKMCTFEYKLGWSSPTTKLDGTEMALDLIMVTVTDTDSHAVYEIRSLFGPRQLLDKQSNLGKALIKKYGAPTTVGSADAPNPRDPVGGGRMAWQSGTTSNGVYLVTDCRPRSDGKFEEKQCRLVVQENGHDIVDRERAKQAESKLQCSFQSADRAETVGVSRQTPTTSPPAALCV
jgi:hypothetical protein